MKLDKLIYNKFTTIYNKFTTISSKKTYIIKCLKSHWIKSMPKGTVSLTSRDPSSKNGNIRFTTVPLIYLSYQVGIGYPCL